MTLGPLGGSVGSRGGGGSGGAVRSVRGLNFTVQIPTPPTPSSVFDVDKYRRRFEVYFREAVREIVIPAAVAVTPFRTGRLRRSWRVDLRTELRGSVLGVYGRFYWIYLPQSDLIRDTVNRAMQRAARVAAARVARSA